MKKLALVFLLLISAYILFAQKCQVKKEDRLKIPYTLELQLDEKNIYNKGNYPFNSNDKYKNVHLKTFKINKEPLELLVGNQNSNGRKHSAVKDEKSKINPESLLKLEETILEYFEELWD